MSEIESVLTASSSLSVFPKYKAELSPVQVRVVRDYVANIRRELIQSAKALGVSLPTAQFGSIHSIHVDLTFADIAAVECLPEQMRGYGEVSPEVAPQLRGMVEQLKSSLGKLAAFLSENTDFSERLHRLEQTGDEINLLERITEIVDRRGMVEFRPVIGAIIERLSSRSFEIAVFGRVSSGKSSLLNHILGSEVLPVGVTPVTAIPTRVIFGPEPAIEVSFAIGRQDRLGVERLPEFVTEQQNKGNEKQITRVIVEIPSRRLEEGIVFVDTPGLGSLATAGAVETLAYLPRCDLGVLLVDSASTLTEEDVGTLRMLMEAGIPPSILLSKADLVEPSDRERTIAYTRERIHERLGVELPITPVSVKPTEAILLDSWFEAEIAPVYARHRELARQSIRRKIGLLRESVESSLRTALGGDSNEDQPESTVIQRAGRELRAATGAFDDVWRRCFQVLDGLREAPDLVITGIARQAAALMKSNGPREIEAEWVRSAAQRIAAEQIRELPKTLAKLALDSAAALSECARDLNTSEAPNPAEFASAIQEMPLIDLGGVEAHLRAGILARTWTGSAVRGFQTQLNEEIGATLRQAFSAYSSVLQRWLRATLKDLRDRFDAYAESYRARIAGMETAVSQSGGTDARMKIVQDLSQLNIDANPAQIEAPSR
jgi:GTP-binding protein EngB required for normal cell division